MPENTTAQFDPGFAPHLIPFLPALQSMESELVRIKNFGQKKTRYKILDKSCQKALQSTLGFWVGCILWGGYIKYKNQIDPKAISGNDFLELKKEDIPDFAYNTEFDAMKNYIENFAKNSKYYTGTNASLPEFYGTIVKEYRAFVELNDNFLNTRTTADIQIPPKFEFLAQYSDTQLEDLGAKIVEFIAKSDLNGFLELDFVKSL